MPKFKHKKTGKIVEANLLYYVNLLRSNSDYKEIKEKVPKQANKELEENPQIEVVEDKPLE